MNEQLSQARLAELLRRLYANRFSARELEEMRGVWRVLVRDFFQKRIRPGVPVLDIGAGACLFVNEVVASRRIALDANPDLKRFAAPGVEVLQTADLSLAPIPDGSMGHVFISNLLEHLAGPTEILNLLDAVHRKLEPGGSLLILQPNFRLSYRHYFDFVDHRTIVTDASLREALEATGFTIRELRARFLPFTSKSRVPKWPFLVRLYLRLPPAQWLLGRQTFVEAFKPRGVGLS